MLKKEFLDVLNQKLSLISDNYLVRVRYGLPQMARIHTEMFT